MRLVVICFLAGNLFAVAVETNTATGKVIIPLDRKFAEQATALERQRYDFDQIFARLCRFALDESARNQQFELTDYARSMFGGLWQWAIKTGNPKLQGRKDWAQHFIGGGAFEGYWDVGPRAAVTKETLDSHDPGNRYDLDDLAATLLGSRWIDIATAGDAAQTRRWLELWATGKYTLSQSLPKLNFGQMPQSEQAEATTVEKIRAIVNSALQPPPPESPAPTAPPHR